MKRCGVLMSTTLIHHSHHCLAFLERPQPRQVLRTQTTGGVVVVVVVDVVVVVVVVGEGAVVVVVVVDDAGILSSLTITGMTFSMTMVVIGATPPSCPGRVVVVVVEVVVPEVVVEPSPASLFPYPDDSRLPSTAAITTKKKSVVPTTQ